MEALVAEFLYLMGLLLYVTLIHELTHAIVALIRNNLGGFGAGLIKKFGWQIAIVVLLKRPDYIVALAPQLIVPIILLAQFPAHSPEFLTCVGINIIGGLADLHHAIIMRRASKGEKAKDIPFWGIIYWTDKKRIIVGWQ